MAKNPARPPAVDVRRADQPSSGDEMMKSAEARLLATGMFHTTAILRSAFTLGS